MNEEVAWVRVRGGQGTGWCSVQLRFDGAELLLLRSAERLLGARFATTPRADALRAALELARTGRKLSEAAPSQAISLTEPELGLLADATRLAEEETAWLARASNGEDATRRGVLEQAFPDLREDGVWRAEGLAQALHGLADRLEKPAR